VAAKAVIDYAAARPDLDSARIGVWGVSLGGYYAPRAAAFDRRISACIALAGPFDWAEAWDGLPELTREAFRVRSHCATLDQAKRHAARLSLNGVAERIACPIFIVTGKLDRVIPWQHAERLANAVSGPAELMIVEDGNHVANNRGYRWRLQSADWMAERLSAAS
jgi:dipeptidyl aminopeptidase/acylaminoacyl peptidase